jgi:CheY-like chemotaxis protein
MREVLEGVGERWEVVEAENGRAAVAKAREISPDLVILDLVMPLFGGLLAARQISKVLPAVPILLHTLYWSEQVEIEAANVGVRKVVRKSDTPALVSAVKEVLASRSPSASVESKRETSEVRRSREDRIRELCNQLFSSQPDDDQAAMFRELQAALHDHIENLRATVADYSDVIELPPQAEESDAAAEPNPADSNRVEPNASKVIPITVIAEQAAEIPSGTTPTGGPVES